MYHRISEARSHSELTIREIWLLSAYPFAAPGSTYAFLYLWLQLPPPFTWPVKQVSKQNLWRNQLSNIIFIAKKNPYLLIKDPYKNRF